MFGGGREKQRQYSSVSTEEGLREGPEVRLNNFWPIMLMVFIGVMTLPTLIVSAVTLARVPEAYDISSITASLDKDTKTTLKSATDAVTSATNKLGTHAAAVSDAASTIQNNRQVKIVNANGKIAAGNSKPSTVCSNSASSTTHTVTRYLVGKSPSSSPNSGASVIMAKICPAVCEHVTGTSVILPPNAAVAVNLPGIMTQLEFNKDSAEKKINARFSQTIKSDEIEENTFTIYGALTNLGEITSATTGTTDDFEITSFSYDISSTDTVIPDSAKIVYRSNFESTQSYYGLGFAAPALMPMTEALTSSQIAGFQVVTNLATLGITDSTTLTC